MKHHASHLDHQAGFSLIVVAALFTAFAVVAAAFLDRNVASQTTMRQLETKKKMTRLIDALSTYANYNNGDLPCPARLDLLPSDTNFGNPVNNNDCDTGAPAAGALAGVYGPSHAPGLVNNAANEFVMGMVPVRALVAYGIDPNDAFDSWNTRIQYVVNRQKTPTGTDANPAQPLSVTEAQLNTTFSSPDFVLVSMGRDQLGGWLKSTNPPAQNGSCTYGTANLRERNCNLDLDFIRKPQVTQVTSVASYFDDIIIPYIVNRPSPETPLSSAFCWGIGSGGQLGINSEDNSSTPTAVDGSNSYLMVSQGSGASCAIDGLGLAYCWGNNNKGQLGLGPAGSAKKLVPTEVNSGYSYIWISTNGSTSCGVRANGKIYCWGENGHKEIDNSGANKNIPTAINDSAGLFFKQVSVGGEHVCGLATSGIIYCWGENGLGQLGDHTTFDRSVPSQLYSTARYSKVTAGSEHTCALTTAGAVQCWGKNDVGQLGNNTTTGATTANADPVNLHGGGTFVDIATGANHSCVLDTLGAAHCWGAGTSGQLGNNNNSSSSSKVAVDGGKSYVRIGAGVTHSCAIQGDGANWCWGKNSSGELGLGVTSSYEDVPDDVTGGNTFSMVDGGTASCGLVGPSPLLRCPVETVTWGGGCLASTNNTITDGTTITDLASTSGTTGDTDVTCYNGMLVLSNSSCATSGTLPTPAPDPGGGPGPGPGPTSPDPDPEPDGGPSPLDPCAAQDVDCGGGCWARHFPCSNVTTPCYDINTGYSC